MNPIVKIATTYVVILILLAFAWPFIPVLPIGHLPGDVISSLGNTTLYLAFGTGGLLTGILAFILYIFQRF